MVTTSERTDSQLKTDVLSELKYDPSVKYTGIGVVVKDGTVILNGSTICRQSAFSKMVRF